MICCSASGVGRVCRIEKDLNDNEYIMIEIERPFFDRPNLQKVDYIPLLDWNAKCRRFSKYIDKGDVLAVKGRIETSEGIGVVIICEQISVILKEKR